MKTHYLILAFIFSLLSAYSQNDTVKSIFNKENSKYKISGVSVSRNILFPQFGENDFSQFMDLSKDKTIFPSDISSYTARSDNSNINQFNLSISFSPFDTINETYNHIKNLKFGINFNNGERRMYSFGLNKYIPSTEYTNTLDTIKVDTLIGKRLFYSETIEELSLDCSYQFFTNPGYFICVNAGLGAELGYSIFSGIVKNSFLDSSLVYHIYQEELAGELKDYFYEKEISINQIDTMSYSKSKRSLFGRAYIPVGINIKLSNNREILNQLYFMLQLKLGIEYQLAGMKYGYMRPFYGTCIGFRHMF